VTGCRPRGRRSASRLLLCVARLAAVSLRRVLLQRVAGWPLANPTEEQSACRRARPSLHRPSPFCMEEPALVQGRMASGPSYGPALAPPLYYLPVCGRFCSNPHPCYAIRVARAKKASRFHAIGPSVAGLETLDFEHLSTWQDAVCARRCVNS
jgi:hypothetical protein